MRCEELPTPALLLDYSRLLQNLQRMQERARQWGVALRPHAKTHKCAEIAQLQCQLGACGITVATLAEARFFADAGIEDITWAFPLPLWAIEPALELASRCCLRLLVDSKAVAEALASACMRRGQRIHAWLEIDCGGRRSGFLPNSPALMETARFVVDSPWLIFDGLLTHAGHAYRASSAEELRRIALQEQETMAEVANWLRTAGIEVPGLSIGSTPTVMAATSLLPDITEIRPGNYVFYDYTQVLLGSCTLQDCALTVLATVVSHQTGATHFVIDAGALALSLDPGPQHLMPSPSYGLIVHELDGTLIPEPQLCIARLSQEHGVVVAKHPNYLHERYPVGSRVRIVENHSCLTAALHDHYWICDAGSVVAQWKIARQRS
ncbi:MAG: alanine racemase [Candidatus Kapabacteria bacterium]|nr:alanine racemase [Candidatus Kapabacteria bacterium]MDW8012506.1 alanine racemase [Bacteroidota bacterium]